MPVSWNGTRKQKNKQTKKQGHRSPQLPDVTDWDLGDWQPEGACPTASKGQGGIVNREAKEVSKLFTENMNNTIVMPWFCFFKMFSKQK